MTSLILQEIMSKICSLWYDTVRGMSRLLGMSQGSSRAIAAASSSGMCSAVSCGRVMSKDVLYSDN